MASLLLLKSMIFTKVLQRERKRKKAKKRVKNSKLGNKCRICNEGGGDIPIFNNYQYDNLADEIHNFSGVMITESDQFTKYMCRSCLDLLNGCILFRDLCKRSEKTLIESANNTIKQEYSPEYNNLSGNGSDESYNIPSPCFSDNSEIWSCSTCMKEFSNLKTYNKHLPKCTKAKEDKIPDEVLKKKFLCETCGKTATSKASLVIHMSTHDNVFPFKCDVCPYQGRTIDLLKVHKRSHLADKPFKCTQCPKATTTSSNLAKHMRHVHSTARPFKCTYCDKFFSYQHDMKRHVKDIHLRQGTVQCDICHKKFNTKKILQGHRWKIHKIKSERSGRLPAYLLCQMEEQDNIHDENMRESLPSDNL